MEKMIYTKTTTQMIGIIYALGAACLMSGQTRMAALTSQPAFTTIYNFGLSTNDGAEPSGLVVDSEGVLYGAAGIGGALGYGAVYSLTPRATTDASWIEAVLQEFGPPKTAQGESPTEVVLYQGALYGTVSAGGASGGGAVFSLTPPRVSGSTWTYTLLYSFKGGTGSAPAGRLALSEDGVLYGTTNYGGTSGYGTAFSLRP